MRDIRFGENGWRARFDDGFDREGVVLVADALARVWATHAVGNKVLVGYDARRQAQEHARAAAQTLAGRGFEVLLADDICPTPALGWCASRDPDCVGAVMITASASSHEYGGIQARLGDGGPVSEAFAQRVSDLIGKQRPVEGKAYGLMDMWTPYRDALMSDFDRGDIRRAGLHVVCDSMYGAVQGHLSQLLADLGCEVETLHGTKVSDFRGLHPRPREPWVDECERTVRRTRASIGIVLDGDGDRLGIVDEQGALISRHDMMPLLLGHLAWGRGVHGRVVSSMATTKRIEIQAARLGLDHTRVPVGFTRTYDEFVDGDVAYAVEERGGICIPHHLRERDGLYASLLAIEMCARSERPLSEDVARMSEALGHWEYAERDLRMEGARVQMLRNLLPGLNPREMCGLTTIETSHADGLRLDLEGGSWLLLRPARSHPVVRVCAEAPVPALAGALVESAIRELAD